MTSYPDFHLKASLIQMADCKSSHCDLLYLLNATSFFSTLPDWAGWRENQLFS